MPRTKQASCKVDRSKSNVYIGKVFKIGTDVAMYSVLNHAHLPTSLFLYWTNVSLSTCSHFPWPSLIWGRVPLFNSCTNITIIPNNHSNNIHNPTKYSIIMIITKTMHHGNQLIYFSKLTHTRMDPLIHNTLGNCTYKVFGSVCSTEKK